MNCHSVFNCSGHNHELTSNRLIKETVLSYVNEAEFKELFTMTALENIEAATSSAIAATSSANKASLDARNAVNDLTIQTIDFVNDAINNTVIEGGVLTDTIVTMTKNATGSVARTLRDVNSDTINPYDFGAVGDGNSHKLSERYATLGLAQEVYPHSISLDDQIDWCAIQGMFNHLTQAGLSKVPSIDLSGNFIVNRGLRYVQETWSGNVAYSQIVGHTNIVVSDDYIKSDEGAVLTLHGRGIKHTGTIYIDCDYKEKHGIRLSTTRAPFLDTINFSMSLGRLNIYRALLYAVQVNNKSMFGNIEYLRAMYCGAEPSAVGKTVSGNYTAFKDTVTTTVSAYTTLTVDKLPDFEVGDYIYIAVAGQTRRVVAIDRVNNTIDVKMNLIGLSESGGEFKYIYGGALFLSGSDSAGFTVGTLSGFGCGITLNHRAMYSSYISNFLSEFAGIAIREEGLVGGANIATFYFEGDNCQYLNESPNPTAYGTTNLLKGTGLDIKKFVNNKWRVGSDGQVSHAWYAGIDGLSVDSLGERFIKDPAKLPKNELPNNPKIELGTPHKISTFMSNSSNAKVSIQITPVEANVNHFFAYDSQTVVVQGRTGSPSSVEFKVPAGFTVNSGTQSKTFTEFNGVAVFEITQNMVTKDIRVSCTTAKTYETSQFPNISTFSGYAGDLKDMPVDTPYHFTDYDSIIGTTIPNPTATTTKNQNFMGTIVVRLAGRTNGLVDKVQYVSFPKYSEVWRRVFTTNTGQYGGWQLESYKTGVGSTPPSNPATGQQYIDSSKGYKTITWTGTAWVDAMGVSV